MKENIPKETKDLIIRLYVADVSIDDIVTCTKLSPTTIRRIIKDANVKKSGELTISDVISKLNDLSHKGTERNMNDFFSPFIRHW